MNAVYFVSCGREQEELLEKELKQILASSLASGEVELSLVRHLGVNVTGDLKAAYQIILYSRIAHRVFLPLKKFIAESPEALYAGVKSIRWSDYISPSNTIAVDFNLSNSQITHSQFAALKTKDAIVDQMRSLYNERPSVDVQNPDLKVNVYLNKDQAVVSIDLSGGSLHLRGYRTAQREAPLKETLAAAMLYSSGWDEMVKQNSSEAHLIDPMCGAGTIIIEAALIAKQIAPGLMRRRHGFQNLKIHDSSLWSELISEAKSKVIQDPKLLPKIIGYDTDPKAIHSAIQNVESANVRDFVHVEKRKFGDLTNTHEASSGLLILNPPYGDRLGEEKELVPLYRLIGDKMKQHFKGWRGGVLTGSLTLSKEIGLKASRRVVMFNGPIECRYLTFELYSGTKDASKTKAE